MSINEDQIRSLGESSVVYSGTDKVGKVGQVYLDDDTGRPSWVTVKTGLFGTAETFVPLHDAQVDGDDLRVGYDSETIKGAPRIEADGSISPQEEDELYRYYGIATQAGTADQDRDRSRDATGTSAGRGDQSGRTTDQNAGRTADVGQPTGVDAGRGERTAAGDRDASERGADDAMTRSEEQVRVGTATRESGRARLRKYVTTEQVTETVPVKREEVTLEREPITDANAAAAGAGPEISEEEHEVTLHEEVPTVDKDVVAVERIKLGKETVTDEQTVSEEVRKEQVEMVEPDTRDETRRDR